MSKENLISILAKRGIKNSTESSFKLEILKKSDENYQITIYNNDNIVKADEIKFNKTENELDKLSIEIFNKIFIISDYE